MLDEYISRLKTLYSHRPEELFTTFLPRGYRMTTLDTVEPALLKDVIEAKIYLGMLITIYDDLADHPEHRDDDLLSDLYKINVGKDFHVSVGELSDLVVDLFDRLRCIISAFPGYIDLIDVLRFDIEQFYCYNRLSSLSAHNPSIWNLSEARALGPHNMGMIAAGIIDLMAVPDARRSELGQCRESFLVAQRMGRISNVLCTYEREKLEGDNTNEIAIFEKSGGQVETYRQSLMGELSECHGKILDMRISSFSNETYACGIMKLHDLHREMTGRI